MKENGPLPFNITRAVGRPQVSTQESSVPLMSRPLEASGLKSIAAWLATDGRVCAHAAFASPQAGPIAPRAPSMARRVRMVMGRSSRPPPVLAALLWRFLFEEKDDPRRASRQAGAAS